jgi:hypothetical protein
MGAGILLTNNNKKVNTQNRKSSVDFVIAHFYKDAPVLVTHDHDPSNPVLIRVDPSVVSHLHRSEQLSLLVELDESVIYPTLVSVTLAGDVEIHFERTGVTRQVLRFEIELACERSTLALGYISLVPEPPYLMRATSTTLLVGWTLPDPTGLALKVELQYCVESSPYPVLDRNSGVWRTAALKKYQYSEFNEHECKDLTPGADIRFRIAYWNVFGKSVFSESSHVFTTSPAPPDPPVALTCTTLLPVCALLSWKHPQSDNGSRVFHYSLRGRSAGAEDFETLYTGPKRDFLVMYLFPDFAYTFEVCAINSCGASDYSQRLNVITPRVRTRSIVAESGGSVDFGEEVSRLADERRDAWIEGFDSRERRAFYFNRLTGERQLAVPRALLPCSDVVEDEEDIEAKNRAEKQYRLRNKLYSLSVSLRRGIPDAAFRSDSFLVQVRRDRLLLDAYASLSSADVAELKKRMKVDFADEAGIDSGGLLKEFYQLVSAQAARYAASPSRKLVASDASGGVYFSSEIMLDVPSSNPVMGVSSIVVMHLNASASAADLASFLGRLVGKAVWDQQCLDFYPSSALAKLMLGEPILLSDILVIDPALHKSLSWILDNDVTGILDDETFSVYDLKTKVSIDLCANGSNVHLSEQNKDEYVRLRAAWAVQYSVDGILRSYLNAFWSLVPLRSLREFDLDSVDLVAMLQGSTRIDIDSIRAYCVFDGGVGFNDQHEQVVTLWCVLRTFNDPRLRLFLSFVTGSARIPLDGFNPPFKITQGVDMCEDGLPRVHTCFNQLVLPHYTSREAMERQIVFAVENCEGFELA